MARKQKKVKLKTITSLHYDRGNTVDKKLIGTVNVFCSLEENEGIPPTSLVRNFLLRKMQEAIINSNQKQAS